MIHKYVALEAISCFTSKQSNILTKTLLHEASFDSNNDGVVSALDENFADVMVWQDTNDNGVTDFGELISLGEVGITSVPIDFRDTFAEAVNETALSELI